jgi:hypothetical protein
VHCESSAQGEPGVDLGGSQHDELRADGRSKCRWATRRADGRAAEQMRHSFQQLAKIAVWFNQHTSWRTFDVFGALGSIFYCRPSPRSVMEHLLLVEQGEDVCLDSAEYMCLFQEVE